MSRNYRRQVITGEDSCSLCGYNKFQGALVVHHIDMNRYNNAKENLVILCSNCHTEVHNRIRKAMNSGRQLNTQMDFISILNELRD